MGVRQYITHFTVVGAAFKTFSAWIYSAFDASGGQFSEAEPVVSCPDPLKLAAKFKTACLQTPEDLAEQFLQAENSTLLCKSTTSEDCRGSVESAWHELDALYLASAARELEPLTVATE